MLQPPESLIEGRAVSAIVRGFAATPAIRQHLFDFAELKTD
jgi:hypothetical protein